LKTKTGFTGQDDLDGLTADLQKAAAEILPQVAKTTGAACNNIKKDVQRRWAGLPHLPHLPRSITYDVTRSRTAVTGEVGADHARKQGKLAWIPEYGSPTSAPHPGFRPATDTEVPTWVRHLEDIVARSLE
jgi:hypothetical protein